MSREKILPVDRTEEPFVSCSKIFFSTSERAMAAFVAAAEELYGIEAGQLATEHWIEQMAKSDWPNLEVSALRQVTIAAASQLAKSTVKDSSNPSRRIVGSHDV